MNSLFPETSYAVGKYLVSPLIQQAADGRFASAVSIRSGAGRGTHDRVFRLAPQFATREGAVRHAAEHAARWLSERISPTPIV